MEHRVDGEAAGEQRPQAPEEGSFLDEGGQPFNLLFPNCSSFLARRDRRQGEKLSFQLLVDILSLSHSSQIKNHDWHRSSK
jgi:hypothetical protein